jgi:protein-tyrosine phosphatase
MPIFTTTNLTHGTVKNHYKFLSCRDFYSFMNQIRPWLYIGKYSDTTNLSLLKFHQIGAMLQLAELVEHPGIISLYLNVDDGVPLPEPLLKEGIEFVKAQKNQGRKIMVSCGAGISRSATFAIAALKEIEQISLSDSYREIKLHHPQTMPHPALWKSLCEYFREEISYSAMLALKSGQRVPPIK